MTATVTHTHTQTQFHTAVSSHARCAPIAYAAMCRCAAAPFTNCKLFSFMLEDSDICSNPATQRTYSIHAIAVAYMYVHADTSKNATKHQRKKHFICDFIRLESPFSWPCTSVHAISSIRTHSHKLVGCRRGWQLYPMQFAEKRKVK